PRRLDRADFAHRLECYGRALDDRGKLGSIGAERVGMDDDHELIEGSRAEGVTQRASDVLGFRAGDRVRSAAQDAGQSRGERSDARDQQVPESDRDGAVTDHPFGTTHGRAGYTRSLPSKAAA